LEDERVVSGAVLQRFEDARSAADLMQVIRSRIVGGGVSLLAYRVMLRIARLPEEERVLR